MDKVKKNTQIILRISEEEKMKWKILAKFDNISLSNLIRKWGEEKVKDKEGVDGDTSVG